MGFLSRIFKKDPAEQLAKARELIRRDNAPRAMEMARQLADAGGPLADEAAAVVEEARQHLEVSTLERASEAEAAGDLEEAIDWMESALQHVQEAERRQELEGRIRELRGALEVRPHASLMKGSASRPARPKVLMASEMEEAAPDVETLYFTLIGTLTDEIAERYEALPPAFQKAWVDLQEGRVGEAEEQLSYLVEEMPAEALVRFERGHARVILGRHEDAAADLETVWPEIGDDYLNHNELSVPGLWADAQLAQGELSIVEERLDPLAQPGVSNRPDLILRRATALVGLERLEDARDLLAAAAPYYPARGELIHALGSLYFRLGDRPAAIDAFETTVRPACSGGTCNKPQLHLPALRGLIFAYLHEGPGTEEEAPNLVQDGASLRRVHELLPYLNQAVGGAYSAGDYRLLAAFYAASGDEEGSQEALEHAARAQPGEVLDTEEPAGDLTAGTMSAPL